MKPFEIAADIRDAETLPGRVYSDPELHERFRDKVFAKSWTSSPTPRR